MRIISLLSSATEMLFAIGLGDQVVAVSHECDYPAAAARLPKATRSFVDSQASSAAIDEQVKSLHAAGAALYGLDCELIRKLSPDLIITQSQCDVCAVRHADVLELVASTPALRKAQVLALNPTSLKDVLDDILRIGRAADAEAEASKCVNGLSERIGRISQQCTMLEPHERLRVVCIEWIEPLMTAGNWTPQLIDLAGGISVLAAAGEHSGYIQWQAIVDEDPQVLIVAPCGFDLSRSLVESQRLLSMPGWNELAAIRSRRSYVIDGNAYLNRSGPRLVDTVEILAHLLHPEYFPEPACTKSPNSAWTVL